MTMCPSLSLNAMTMCPSRAPDAMMCPSPTRPANSLASRFADGVDVDLAPADLAEGSKTAQLLGGTGKDHRPCTRAELVA